VQPELAELVQSFFYLLLEERPEILNSRKKSDLYGQFKSRLEKTVTDVLHRGYYLPDQRSGLEFGEEITRGDLWRTRLNIKQTLNF
ncbi:MAG: hypothetical protein ONB12_05535, partial [candidate division KSB1 bacterium]|nr:hypothetical protein [candidate division KSB1 bacterium]